MPLKVNCVLFCLIVLLLKNASQSKPSTSKSSQSKTSTSKPSPTPRRHPMCDEMMKYAEGSWKGERGFEGKRDACAKKYEFNDCVAVGLVEKNVKECNRCVKESTRRCGKDPAMKCKELCFQTRNTFFASEEDYSPFCGLSDKPSEAMAFLKAKSVNGTKYGLKYGLPNKSNLPSQKKMPYKSDLPEKKDLPGKSKLPDKKKLPGAKNLPGKNSLAGKKK